MGVILKNENILEEMIDILLQLHCYVPTKHGSIIDPGSGTEVSRDVVHKILFGGDQLTRKRAESAKEGRRNSITAPTKLDGFVPVCEDWHAKKIFLEVSYFNTVYEIFAGNYK